MELYLEKVARQAYALYRENESVIKNGGAITRTLSRIHNKKLEKFFRKLPNGEYFMKKLKAGGAFSECLNAKKENSFNGYFAEVS